MSLPNPPPDELLALGKLLEEYRPRLVALVRRSMDYSLMSRLDADDIVNNAFLRAQRKWAAFGRRPDGQAYTWLAGIVRDCLSDAWRQETRDRRDPHRETALPD